jgi:hypothetical protein
MKYKCNIIVFPIMLVIIASFVLIKPPDAVSTNNQTDPVSNNSRTDSPVDIGSIPLPQGFRRMKLARGSFGRWLRKLPLKPSGEPVLLYNGKEKENQEAHYAVVKMDIGDRDLQQCADAIIRLKAEYHFAMREYGRIRFNLTSGHRIPFLKWAAGYRLIVNGNRVKWIRSSKPDMSYANLRAYLDIIFQYAGSYSLSKELNKVDPVDLQPGDIFIQGGFPGHAVIVVDIAEHIDSGKKIFLLAQSFMPAQEIHVLKNPSSEDINPWYRFDFVDKLVTPEWTFKRDDIRRF